MSQSVSEWYQWYTKTNTATVWNIPFYAINAHKQLYELYKYKDNSYNCSRARVFIGAFWLHECIRAHTQAHVCTSEFQTNSMKYRAHRSACALSSNGKNDDQPDSLTGVCFICPDGLQRFAYLSSDNIDTVGFTWKVETRFAPECIGLKYKKLLHSHLCLSNKYDCMITQINGRPKTVCSPKTIHFNFIFGDFFLYLYL